MKYYFGFLPITWELQFPGGSASSIPEFDKIAEQVDNFTKEDGFMYPFLR